MDKMLQIAEGYSKALSDLSSDIEVMNTTLRSIEARLNRSFPERPENTPAAE